MKVLAKLLTVVGAAVVLLIGTAPAALAGSDAVAYVCDSYCYAGSVYFHNYGDYFTICDKAPDGYAVALDGFRPSGDEIRAWDTHGSGTCVTADYNFSEGYTIEFWACIGYGSTNTLIACGNNPAYGVT
jgi:hypothetical protein